MDRGHTSSKAFLERCDDSRSIVFDQKIDQTTSVALFSTINTPDQRPIASIKFLDACLLLNYFWAIESQSCRARSNQVTTKASDNRHAPKAANHSCDYPDHRYVAT